MTDPHVSNSSYDFSCDDRDLPSPEHKPFDGRRDLQNFDAESFTQRTGWRQSVPDLDFGFQNSTCFFQDLEDIGVATQNHFAQAHGALGSQVPTRHDVLLEPTPFHASCRDLNSPGLDNHLAGAKASEKESHDFPESYVRSGRFSTTGTYRSPQLIPDLYRPLHTSLPSLHQKQPQHEPPHSLGSVAYLMPSVIPVEISALEDANRSGQPIAVVASPNYLFNPSSLPSEYAYSFLGLFFLVNIHVSMFHIFG